MGGFSVRAGGTGEGHGGKGAAGSLLPREEEVGRREDLVLAALDEVDGRGVEHGAHVRRALGRDAQELQRADHGVRARAAEARHAEAAQRHLAVERVVPGDLRRRVGVGVGVAVLEHLEARRLERRDDVRRRRERREAVADLDALLDRDVARVRRVVAPLGKDDPLVAREEAARLQAARDLGEAPDLVRRVARRLDLVGHVEARRPVLALIINALPEPVLVVGPEPGQVLEVAAREVRRLPQTLLLAVLVADLDLVLVDRDALDGRAREDGHVPHGPADAAAHVQRRHAGLHAEARAEVVLGALDGLEEGLAPVARREVEGLAPAVLVEVRHKIIKVVDHRAVALAPLVDGRLRGHGAVALQAVARVLARLALEQVRVGAHRARDLVAPQDRVRVRQHVHAGGELAVEGRARAAACVAVEAPALAVEHVGPGRAGERRRDGGEGASRVHGVSATKPRKKIWLRSAAADAIRGSRWLARAKKACV